MDLYVCYVLCNDYMLSMLILDPELVSCNNRTLVQIGTWWIFTPVYVLNVLRLKINVYKQTQTFLCRMKPHYRCISDGVGNVFGVWTHELLSHITSWDIEVMSLWWSIALAIAWWRAWEGDIWVWLITKIFNCCLLSYCTGHGIKAWTYSCDR